MALVSSSALARLEVCLTTTALADLFPPNRRVSAQDSLSEPTSKPDPAVYLAALELLELAPEQALAVEDATSGVRSAIGAGVPVVGNLAFVPAAQRRERERELVAAGAAAVVTDWEELEALMGQPGRVTTTT
jgi:beta-phosphoglucomutase-like phosphatase (HAD superfamily)